MIVIVMLSIGLLCVSCKERSDSSKNTEGDLITKINAVQEQVMAQGNVSAKEEQALLSLCSIVSQNDGMAIYTSDDSIILKDVEIAPVYNGCEDLSEKETRECFKEKVAEFVKDEFNSDLLKDLSLSEPKEVESFFIITENGNLTGIKVRDTELNIQAEILRVLRKLPVMKPAIDDGKNVSVLCSIVVRYKDNIEIDFVYIPERPN
ncbi:hypothetical protein [Christiangramia sp. OXR-203]|jgi:RecG-like helicase|uniref:hypothetical protein n=1 Tax=Christiangramia sp. OXR-203 TaxID=3100176 RepID=UPI002AC91B3C|nr:hypothetical protein [Christiangramia sp. OXR-203]WPY97680.1 hypothetical protein T8I65_10885 [Christiangramia sp. OXR-203]